MPAAASPVTLVWFRRDLRLDDNPALIHAARRGGAVVPVYVWSPDELDRAPHAKHAPALLVRVCGEQQRRPGRDAHRSVEPYAGPLLGPREVELGGREERDPGAVLALPFACARRGGR